ncbi:hypothetical protein GPJ56_003350 [Histomonas meleagridis]|uniref:uncharacterized protein n=1 Tax=Histomonas meleagridis TaxID=135588 RepID=UPI00355A83A0|nr:hypothetical protein GPJ56_003350 [Histomonas meleagridis]KAH0804969.1 hypothetical protein GO595_001914 [Histomonas meleagridis]
MRKTYTAEEIISYYTPSQKPPSLQEFSFITSDDPFTPFPINANQSINLNTQESGDDQTSNTMEWKPVVIDFKENESNEEIDQNTQKSVLQESEHTQREQEGTGQYMSTDSHPQQQQYSQFGPNPLYGYYSFVGAPFMAFAQYPQQTFQMPNYNLYPNFSNQPKQDNTEDITEPEEIGFPSVFTPINENQDQNFSPQEQSFPSVLDPSPKENVSGFYPRSTDSEFPSVMNLSESYEDQNNSPSSEGGFPRYVDYSKEEQSFPSVVEQNNDNFNDKPFYGSQKISAFGLQKGEEPYYAPINEPKEDEINAFPSVVNSESEFIPSKTSQHKEFHEASPKTNSSSIKIEYHTRGGISRSRAGGRGGRERRR